MRSNERSYCGTDFTLHPLEAEKLNRRGVHLNYKKQPELPLNNYGEGPFCEFNAPIDIGDKKGIYIFIVNDEVKYLGRCTNTFRRRISEGYGHISPRNCFKGGQPTNCHINKELNKAFENGEKVFIGIHFLDDDSSIRELEKKLLKEHQRINPNNWNIQH